MNSTVSSNRFTSAADRRGAMLAPSAEQMLCACRSYHNRSQPSISKERSNTSTIERRGAYQRACRHIEGEGRERINQAWGSDGSNARETRARPLVVIQLRSFQRPFRVQPFEGRQ
eukprot:767389-Hanusia_phi.AAC.1